MKIRLWIKLLFVLYIAFTISFLSVCFFAFNLIAASILLGLAVLSLLALLVLMEIKWPLLEIR